MWNVSYKCDNFVKRDIADEFLKQISYELSKYDQRYMHDVNLYWVWWSDSLTSQWLLHDPFWTYLLWEFWGLQSTHHTLFCAKYCLECLSVRMHMTLCNLLSPPMPPPGDGFKYQWSSCALHITFQHCWIGYDSPDVQRFWRWDTLTHTSHVQDSDVNNFTHWHTSWTPSYSLIQGVFCDVKDLFWRTNSLKQC